MFTYSDAPALEEGVLQPAPRTALHDALTRPSRVLRPLVEPDMHLIDECVQACAASEESVSSSSSSSSSFQPFLHRPASGLHESASQAALEHTQATTTRDGPANHHPPHTCACAQTETPSDCTRPQGVSKALCSRTAGGQCMHYVAAFSISLLFMEFCCTITDSLHCQRSLQPR